MADDTTIKGHEEIFKYAMAAVDQMTPPGVELKLPPPATTTLGLHFEEFTPGHSITASVEIPEKYGNVMGLLLGGFLAAMFDDLMAPLSYITAKNPTTSLDLTTHFLRPVFVGERLTLTATVRKPGSSAMFVGAEAYNSKNKLVATAISSLQVMQLSKS
ncbi:PaaI family thioesterase [Nocardia pseudobrasiliensis]|uniref:Uncharacterized protein (TIGR00369 family) n=1 Tax=Nocardia pseudobrasiliensis TaxID=45979 RepID=A0A370IBF8_9NOCA|nr:PaaI family thioesterase [Nocardia pseudobrasiliensis]RDI66724.1 uncharacterized protein (TIGR00369 family) [Nocardia pseudobrasiliensis]